MCRKTRAFIIFFLIAVMLFSAMPSWAVTPMDWSADHPEDLEDGHIFAQSAILMDAESGTVLFDKSPDKRMFPASTTKIMTLMLGLESGIPLDTVVTVPKEAVDIPSDSSKIPISAGEQLTYQDLLYGFMLNSGNDGAIAIAMLVSGSVEQFVAAMNQRAAELGCTNTHFANPHGYHDDNHYTTARDLALITQEAIKNPTFVEIVSTPSYIMASTNKHKRREIKSRVEMLLSDNKYYFAECTGVKTGYTGKAGQCFVGTAERGTRTIISVVLFSTRDYPERKFFDTTCMFMYGFTRYDRYNIRDIYEMAGDGLNSVMVENAASDDIGGGRLSLILSQTSNDGYDVMALKDTDEISSYVDDFNSNSTITFSTVYLDKLENRETIEAGSIVGTLTYSMKDGSTLTGTVIASRNVELKPLSVNMHDYLLEKLPFLKTLEDERTVYIIISLIVLIVLIVIIAAVNRIRRDRRRKRIYEQRRRAYYERMRREGRLPQSKNTKAPRRDPYDHPTRKK